MIICSCEFICFDYKMTIEKKIIITAMNSYVEMIKNNMGVSVEKNEAARLF